LSLSDWLLQYEPQIRLAAFIGVLLAMAGWELLAPWRRPVLGRAWRWGNNLGIVAVNTLLLRLIFPAAAVGFALFAERHDFGLFNWIDLPAAVEWLAAILLLDLAIYWQHRAFHMVPMFWRLHRMHHADVELDVTTGTRFHPVEILGSMAIKFVVVCALGAAPAAVLIFEALLNATSMFSHANIRLPAGVDAWVRRLIVTPDMHRVHHSTVRAEHDSNFGFNLSVWDRLFGSYRQAPAAGPDAVTIGLDRFRDPSELRLDRMLMQPLR